VPGWAERSPGPDAPTDAEAVDRFALYAVPARDHPLTRLAASWLGRDAWTGEAVAHPAAATTPALAGLEDLEAATAFPRTYGFHGTLKAPFRLAPARTEAAMRDFARRFAAAWRPLPPASLVPRPVGRFVALVPAHPCPGLDRLAARTVSAFEPFRAPLCPAERARRLAGGLTARQAGYLDRWGYPYVRRDFAFHMTLTGPLADPVARRAYGEAFAGLAARALAAPVDLGWLALFRQTGGRGPFTIVEAWRLGDRQTGDRQTGAAART
jgi:hypothetical protein